MANMSNYHDECAREFWRDQDGEPDVREDDPDSIREQQIEQDDAESARLDRVWAGLSKYSAEPIL